MDTRIRNLWDHARVLLAGPPHDLVADRGRVNCPFSQSDIEVDACFSCPRVTGVEVDGDGNGWVRCTAGPH